MKVKNMSWDEIRIHILERDRYICQHCKREYPPPFLHVHHITPRAVGGKDTPENLITLCWDCHSKAHPGGIVRSIITEDILKSITIIERTCLKCGKKFENISDEMVNFLGEFTIPSAPGAPFGKPYEPPIAFGVAETYITQCVNCREVNPKMLWEHLYNERHNLRPRASMPEELKGEYWMKNAGKYWAIILRLFELED
ncbi:MAG: HNH endonuclease [Candidatus Thermoplasmatota archaeon]